MTNPKPRAENLFVQTDAMADSIIRLPKPEFVIALYEDGGTLTLGIRPDGQIETGPNYRPDTAAREFWDAVTRAAQSASPWTQNATSKEQA